MSLRTAARSSLCALVPAALIAACALPARTSAQPAATSGAPAHDAMGPAGLDSVLVLGDLERAVLERNASYAAARAALREAEAHADVEGSLEDPMIDVEAAPRSLGSGSVAAGWRAEISEAVPLFGQRGLRRRAAEQDAAAARGSYDVARLDLIHAARTAFYDDYHFAEVRSTALQTLEWMRREREAALARYGAGSVPQQDVLAADVEIAMLDHQAVAAERGRMLVEARIRALLHLDPLAPLPSPPDTLSLPDRDETRLMVMRSNERDRPEIRRAQAEVEARRTRLALALRERLPETRLGVGYDRTLAEPEYRAMVRVSVTAPLSAGRHAAAEREAQAGLDGAAARLDAARDEQLRGITDASTEFEESFHEFEVLRDGLLPATDRSLAAARADYEAGRAGIDTVIRAVRDLLDARLEYHRTIAGVCQARADLERALGGPLPPAGEEPR